MSDGSDIEMAQTATPGPEHKQVGAFIGRPQARYGLPLYSHLTTAALTSLRRSTWAGAASGCTRPGAGTLRGLRPGR